MDSQTTTTTTSTSKSAPTNLYILAIPLLLPILILSIYPSRVLRWFQRKRYQYEVTFSLYMLTPTEKFIFNSVLFLFLAMVVIAAALYLPQSMSNVLRRGWYYLLGDSQELGSVKGLINQSAQSSPTALITTHALGGAVVGAD